VITHKFLDDLQEFANNAHEAGNEKLLEHAQEFLKGHISSIQQARKAGQATEAFFMKKVAEDKMRTLRSRADHWEAKLFREKLPEHIQAMTEDLQNIWLRSFRAEFKKTESVGMANMVAEEAVARTLRAADD
jgi:hypothetical protein